MHLLKKYKIALIILTTSLSVQIIAKPSVTICLTGRIVKSLTSYGESFTNAAYLAREQNQLNDQIEIKTYFYNNTPLEPIRIYNKMRQDGCSAIIGFEYLSDLLLVKKVKKENQVPIFTSYASTKSSEKLSNDIFIFMPDYNFLSQKMLSYLKNHFGDIQNILIITEINRDEMKKYKEVYSELLDREKIMFNTFDFLENDPLLDNKLAVFLKNKKYKYVFLLSGTIASAKIAKQMNNHNVIFIGTENYGSSINQSFYLQLKDKNIKSFFIRNIDFLKENIGLEKFRIEYMEKYHNQPTVLSAYTYDAANIIFKTFKKTGSVSTDNILSTNYNGITGASLNNGMFYRSKNYIILSVSENGYLYEE